jgi:hypothetical protein
MQPIYATKLLRNKPTTICQRIYSRENLLQLNDCFELTDWNIFTDNSVDLDILTETVTGYINFCTDLIIPSKKIKIYGNNNPWMTSALKKLVIEKKQTGKTDKLRWRMKQKEINIAIQKAKSKHKAKVEELFKSNSTYEAWKGLKVITNQTSQRIQADILQTAGSATNLNKFFARFDISDFRNEQ